LTVGWTASISTWGGAVTCAWQGDGVVLTVLGQTLTGNFAFEQ